MANSVVENLMEWVGVFRSVEENVLCESEVCIFLEDKGVPNGFNSADEVSGSRVTFYDDTLRTDVKDSAFLIGYGDEITLSGLLVISNDYAPKIVGVTEDGYTVIIGQKRETTMPSKCPYSPDQLYTVQVWLMTLLPLQNEQVFVIMKTAANNTLFADNADILLVKFINDEGEIEPDIIDNTLYAGVPNNVTWNILDELSEIPLKEIACSPDGILALLY